MYKTWAHLVQRNKIAAATIRVGIFRHSFLGNHDSLPKYVEVPAKIVNIDRDNDFALLGITVPHDLYRVQAGIAPRLEEIVGVSVVPFGQPTTFPDQVRSS